MAALFSLGTIQANLHHPGERPHHPGAAQRSHKNNTALSDEPGPLRIRLNKAMFSARRRKENVVRRRIFPLPFLF